MNCARCKRAFEGRKIVVGDFFWCQRCVYEQEKEDHELRARLSDPPESQRSGASVETREGTTKSFTPHTHKHLILKVYARAGRPITDTEAWREAGVGYRSAAWHRCSDLLHAGAIVQVDTVRDTETKQEVRRCVITPRGEWVLGELDAGRAVRLP